MSDRTRANESRLHELQSAFESQKRINPSRQPHDQESTLDLAMKRLAIYERHLELQSIRSKSTSPTLEKISPALFEPEEHAMELIREALLKNEAGTSDARFAEQEEKFEGLIRYLNGLLDDLREENASLKLRFNESSAEHESREYHIQTMQTRHEQEIEALHSNSYSLATACEMKDEELARMQTDIDTLNHRLATNLAETIRLQSYQTILPDEALVNLQDKLVQTNSLVAEMNIERTDALQRITEQDKAIETLVLEKHQLTLSLEQLKSDMAALQSEHNESLDSFKIELKTVNENFDAAKSGYESDLALIQQQMTLQGNNRYTDNMTINNTSRNGWDVEDSLQFKDDFRTADLEKIIEDLNLRLVDSVNQNIAQSNDLKSLQSARDDQGQAWIVHQQQLEQANQDLVARLDLSEHRSIDSDKALADLELALQLKNEECMQHQQLSHTINDLSQKLNESLHCLTEKDQTIHDMQQRHDQMNHGMHAQQLLLQSNYDDLNTRLLEMTQTISQYAHTTDTHQALKITISDLTHQLESSEQVLSTTSITFDSERLQYEQERAELCFASERNIEALEQEKQTNSVISGIIDTLQEDKEALRLELEAAVKNNDEGVKLAYLENKRLEALVYHADQELVVALMKIGTLESDIESLSGTVCHLESEKEELSCLNKDELLALQDTYNAQHQLDESHIEQLTQQAEHLNTALTESTTKHQDLQRIIDEQSHQLDATTQRTLSKEQQLTLAIEALSTENDDLRTNTYAIENECFALQSQCDELKASMIECSEKIDRMLTEAALIEITHAEHLETANAAIIAEFEEKNAESCEAMSRLEQEMSQAMEMLRIMKENAASAEQDHIAIISNLKLTISELEIKDREFDSSLKAVADEHQRQLHVMQASFDDKEFAFAQTSSQSIQTINQLTLELIEKNSVISQLCADAETSDKLIKDKTDEAERLERDLVQKEEERAGYVTVLMQENDELRMHSYTLEDNINALYVSKTELEARVTEFGAVEEECDGLKLQILDKTAGNEALRGEMDDLVLKNEDYKRSCGELDEQAFNTRAECDRLCDTILSKNAEIDALKGENESLVMESGAVKQCFDAKIETITTELVKLRLENEDNALLGDDMLLQNDQIAELQLCLDAIQAEKKVVELRVAELESLNASISTQRLVDVAGKDILLAEISECKEAHARSEMDNASLEHQLTTLKMKLTEMQSSLDQSLHISSPSQDLTRLESENAHLNQKLNTLDRDFRIVAKLLRQSKQTDHSSSSFRSSSPQPFQITQALHSNQHAEIQHLREALLNLTQFKPGNTYDHPLLRCQKELEELRVVWSQSHQSNTQLRSLVYAAEGGQGCSYATLQAEFNTVVAMLDECIIERDALRHKV